MRFEGPIETAILVGQGPSSWDLDRRRDEVLGWLSSGAVVAVCNRRWKYVPASLVFAVDYPLVLEFIRERGYEVAQLVTQRSVVQDVSLRGAADAARAHGFVYWECETEPGLSSGATAFRFLLPRAKSIYLIGFDGSLDQRNPYTGTPGYHPTRVSSRGTFYGWEKKMVEMARAIEPRPRIVLGLPAELGPHQLEEIATRVTPDALYREVEGQCQSSRCAR